VGRGGGKRPRSWGGTNTTSGAETKKYERPDPGGGRDEKKKAGRDCRKKARKGWLGGSRVSDWRNYQQLGNGESMAGRAGEKENKALRKKPRGAGRGRRCRGGEGLATKRKRAL